MTARITLALLLIVPAAMAYPWATMPDRYLLGAAVAIVIVLFGRWHGMFFTDFVARRFAVWRRNLVKDSHAKQPPPAYATVLLKVDPGEAGAVPLALVAGYLDRYGVRADKVRITSRDTDSGRTTWISLTIGAADNLAALRARSTRMPLRETAEVAGRRLADRLREVGFDVMLVSDTDDVPTPASAGAKETWRGLRTESGYVAAYQIAGPWGDTLPAVWSFGPSSATRTETWTALEITGTAAHPRVVAVCTLRTDKRPPVRTPLPMLTPQRGAQRPAIEAFDPRSIQRLGTGSASSAGEIEQVHWQPGAVNRTTSPPLPVQ